VRVIERHPDLDAAVFERVDVLDLRQRPEPFVAVGPDLQQQLEMPQRQRAKRRGRILCEYHHLADAASGGGWYPQRWRVVRRHGKSREQVFKDRDIPGAGWHLGRVIGAAAHGERVVIGGRQKGAMLPVGGIGDPFGAQRMPTQMPVRRIRCGARCGRVKYSLERVAGV
jgi:hypothetical protein